MAALMAVVLALISISFLCSTLESVLLSISDPYIQTLIDRKRKVGPILARLKQRINDPISAILTLNTVANTAGAAVAGALALQIFGSRWMAAFSGILTFLILVFAEIIPKTLGASYWKALAPFSGWTLNGLVFLLRPITVPVNFLSGLISRKSPAHDVSKEEVLHAIRLGYLQGVIESSEFEIVSNLMKLKHLTVERVMTPRSVVFRLPSDATTHEAQKRSEFAQFSRIPLYNPQTDAITGIVLRRDIMMELAQDRLDTPLKDLAAEPLLVHENLSVYELLTRLITQQVHLAVVLDEYGSHTGVVTMEDAIETLLGREIIDESDKVVDMRELAKQRMRERLSRSRGI